MKSKNGFSTVAFLIVILLAASVSRGEKEIEEKPAFSFAVMADIQYADADHGGSRYFRESLEKLKQAAADLNKKKPAFVIELGDLINDGVSSYDRTLAVCKQFSSPVYHVIGNHDASAIKSAGKDIQHIYGIKKGYYDFVYKGWRFIILDGNDLSLHATSQPGEAYTRSEAMFERLKKQNAVNAMTWNGGLGEAQLAWFENKLTLADKARENVLVFCHFPLFPENAHNLWNDRQVLGAIDRHECVRAYFAGHNHGGNYGLRKGVHYITLKGMVESKDATAYALVNVFPGRLQVVGFGTETTRTLKFIKR